MSGLTKLAALLLAALWLPAVMHCELEAAEIHFLTHGGHHDAAEQHADSDHHSDAEHHALDDTPFTSAASVVKVLPPGNSLSAVLLALIHTGRDATEPALSPPRHGPPPEWRVAWQFITRAAPAARAPSFNS